MPSGFNWCISGLNWAQIAFIGLIWVLHELNWDVIGLDWARIRFIWALTGLDLALNFIGLN